MASAKSLKKYAKNSLSPYMAALGFELIKGLSYVKEAPEGMTYFVDCFASRWGNVTFDVGIYVPELDEEEREDLAWPKVMRSLVGGELQEDSPMLKYVQHCWNFESEPEAVIDRVQAAIEKYAIPFFEEIQSREDMVNAIDNDWYKWQRDEELLGRILQKP
ncbi:DUF4304 domain-containing protein [Pseudoalteromonas sp. T1lg22]|uniref:DUF4304 domain-containing protein n=1 Tax=Pseudoalteromonas sp. T1lg22 TaxID=2077096 RepID=UPI000CF739D0|nr:DUF4304 domain-containing protein [Pseudoalteromonas sp. T1lg22]